MTKVKLWAALVLLVLVLIVIFQNREPVVTKLLFATIEMPQAALLALVMLLGVLVGVLLALAMAKRGAKKE